MGESQKRAIAGLVVVLFCCFSLQIVQARETNMVTITIQDGTDESWSGLEEGKFEMNTTCSPCFPGSYSGHFQDQGKTYNCSEFCAPGMCPAEFNCTLCPAGSANDKWNATSCTSCGQGYASLLGARNCSACPAGMSSNDGNTMCQQCPSGTYSPYPGSECAPCRPGKYSAMGMSNCLECQKGSYNPASGQGYCYGCGAGKFNPQVGQKDRDSCLPCPSGYYCPFVMTEDPQPCPTDYFCKSGFAEPHSCPILFESNDSLDACRPKAVMYLLIVAGAAAIVLLIAVVVTVRSTNRREAEQRAVSESDRLIPQPRDGPVYEGL